MFEPLPVSVEEIGQLAKRPAAIEGLAPRQWRVTWHERPATEAVVSWSTGEAGSRHVLYFDIESREGNLAEYRWNQPADSGRYRLHPDRVDDEREPTAYFHHVRLTGLRPSTTYYFTMVSDGNASRELHFVTAPEKDRAFSLLAGGDSRSRREARIRVNLTMAALLESNPEILALSHGGDYNDSGARLHDWMLWLTDHELTTTPGGRVLPVIPTRGNHEARGPGYDDVFDTPGGEGRNYLATEFGPQAALITLNTEIPQGGEQQAWLEEQLARLRPQHRWLLTSQHYPNYPAVKNVGGCKALWVPLFERYHLDLSLESDGHCIKRTMPIRDDRPDPTGIVYLGEGGLGAPQRNVDLTRWYVQPPAVAGKGDHVCLLDFSEEALRIRIVLVDDGRVFDDYTLRPRPLEVRQSVAEPAAAGN